MEAFLGEIRLFSGNYAPMGWHLCDGSTLPINGNEALYSLLGVTWGGDGRTNFGLPDLRGRVPVCRGQGTGLTARTTGQTGGASTVQLTDATMPTHTHALMASNQTSTTPTVTTGVGFASCVTPPTGKTVRYAPPGASPAPVPVALANTAVSYAAGGGGAHSNVMPYMALTYIIATQGIYPNRP